MTIRLRAHHLLCMLTYVGKGYSPAFVANYDAIVARLGSGEEILLVDGPDDICTPVLGEPDSHCLNGGVAERDRDASAAVAALIGRPLAAGARLTLDAAMLAGMRQAFAAGATRAACSGCEWSGLCSDVAGGGFDGVRLDVRDPARDRTADKT